MRNTPSNGNPSPTPSGKPVDAATTCSDFAGQIQFDEVPDHGNPRLLGVLRMPSDECLDALKAGTAYIAPLFRVGQDGKTELVRFELVWNRLPNDPNSD